MLNRNDPIKEKDASKIWIAALNSTLLAMYLQPNFGRVQKDKIFAYLGKMVMPQWHINDYRTDEIAALKEKIYLIMTAPDFGAEYANGRFKRSPRSMQKIIFSLWSLGAHEVLKLYGHTCSPCSWDEIPDEKKKECPVFIFSYQKFSDLIAEILRHRAIKKKIKEAEVDKKG